MVVCTLTNDGRELVQGPIYTKEETTFGGKTKNLDVCVQLRKSDRESGEVIT
jgi:hypothetical protein